jgi:hypothetical protein
MANYLVTRGKYETDNVLNPSVPNKSIPECYRMENEPAENPLDAPNVSIPSRYSRQWQANKKQRIAVRNTELFGDTG